MNTPPTARRMMSERPARGGQAGDLLGNGAGARWPNLRRPRCAAAGEAYGCVPVPHSCLADTPSVAYLPKTSPGLLAQTPAVVTVTAVEATGTVAYGHSVPNQSPLQHCARPVPVSRARPKSRPTRKVWEVVGVAVAVHGGASPGAVYLPNNPAPQTENRSRCSPRWCRRAYRRGDKGRSFDQNRGLQCQRQ